MRIVSLLPSATEILFALGLGEDVVGVTFECNFPIEALTKQIVSTSGLPEGLSPGEIDTVVRQRIADGEDLYHLDRKALADLDPELIVTQDLCRVCALDVSDVDEALEYLGCKADVLTLDPMTLDDVLTSISTVGTATDTEDKAVELVAMLRHRIETVADSIAPTIGTEEQPNVLLIEWMEPAFTGGHWVPDMITAAGGNPVLGFAGRRSEEVTWQQIGSSGADIAVVAPCGFDIGGAADQARTLIDRGMLPASAEVWAVDADALIVRPGPRVVDGVEMLASIFHPEHVGLPNPSTARRLH